MYLADGVFEKIINDFENGDNIDNIAKRYLKTKSEIKQILFRSNDERAKKILIRLLKEEVPEIDEIMQKYLEGKSANSLSIKYACYADKLRIYIYVYLCLIGKENLYRGKGNKNNNVKYSKCDYEEDR